MALDPCRRFDSPYVSHPTILFQPMKSAVSWTCCRKACWKSRKPTSQEPARMTATRLDADHIAAPTRLRTEHLGEAIGITNTQPRLGWTPPEGTVRQIAYEVKASNGWQTGRIESAAHGGILYSGPALRARDRFEWRVRTWNEVARNAGAADSGAADTGTANTGGTVSVSTWSDPMT